MLVDAFRRLEAFGPLPDYEYVGFGAHEFIDFELMWRRLGITRLTSIEETLPPDRYVFNAPFRGVRVEPGTARQVLPNLPLKARTIVWLDYTGRLDVSMIADVNGLLRRLISGSAVVVTVNVQPEDLVKKRRAGAEARLGRGRVSSSLTDADFAKWGLSTLSHRILRDEAAQTMRARPDRSLFKQIIHFHYQDSTKMLTWGGVIVDPADNERFEAADFGSLPFGSLDGASPFPINPPALTIRELATLNRELPQTGTPASPLSWVTNQEFEDYIRLHRWYPSLTSLR